MKKLKVCPYLSNMETVTSFVENNLLEDGCSAKIVMKMNIAVDELFSNVAYYSGASETSIYYESKDGFIYLAFVDNGIEYDPTRVKDPDISLSAGERRIGGLGIFMVKQFVDEISYKYINGKNVLVLKKSMV